MRSWVIVCHDEFFVLFALGTTHAVISGGEEDVEILIQFLDIVSIVVADHDLSLGFFQGVPKASVVIFGKDDSVKALGFVVGWVAVDKGILTVILGDDGLKVLVLNDHILEVTGEVPDVYEKSTDVALLTAEGISVTVEAVSEQFVVHGGSFEIFVTGSFPQDGFQLLGLGWLEHDLGKLQFCLQVCIGKLFLGHKFLAQLKIIS